MLTETATYSGTNGGAWLLPTSVIQGRIAARFPLILRLECGFASGAVRADGVVRHNQIADQAG